MRRTFVSWLLLLAILSSVGGLAVMGSQPSAKVKIDEPSSNTISGSGCVTVGVEPGCLLVTDTKTGTVFNVYFRGAKPRVGTAIRFTGTRHDGPTTCMQGQAVNVRSWFQLKMKCRGKTITNDSGDC